jgi:hypothetical protein
MAEEENKSKDQQSQQSSKSENKSHQTNESFEWKHRIGDDILNKAESNPSTPTKPPVDLTTTIETHNREDKTTDNKE